MRILLIDDEPAARKLLRIHLAECPGAEVVGEAADGFEGFRLVRELAPDALFLDMSMPKLTGLEMLELLEPEARPAVVFATAHDQYALQAFEQNAVDYLLKPFTRERVLASFRKLEARLAQQGADLAPLRRDLNPRGLERIAVKWRGKITVLPLAEIHAFESDGDYAKIHSAQGVFLKELTLKQLEESLPTGEFIRTHRSALVRLASIASVEPAGTESWEVVLQDALRFRVSAEGRKILRQALGI